MKIPLLHVHIVTSKTLARLAEERELSNKIMANLLNNNVEPLRFFRRSSRKNPKGMNHK